MLWIYLCRVTQLICVVVTHFQVNLSVWCEHILSKTFINEVLSENLGWCTIAHYNIAFPIQINVNSFPKMFNCSRCYLLRWLPLFTDSFNGLTCFWLKDWKRFRWKSFSLVKEPILHHRKTTPWKFIQKLRNCQISNKNYAIVAKRKQNLNSFLNGKFL